MQKTKRVRPRFYIKLFLWVLLVQLLLINISAALYAYKFTHFYTQAADWNIAQTKNIFVKTGKLFSGPSFKKDTTEPLPPFPYEKVIFRTGNKLRIDAWQAKVPSSKGTVALFHGLMANKSHLSNEAAFFLSLGYNVLMVDFRGHGRSEGLQTTLGVKEAEEVKLACTFLEGEGEKKIFLYGMSLGAVAVSRAIAIYSVRPAGVILDMPFDGLIDHIKGRGRTSGFPQWAFGFPVTLWIGIENNIGIFNHNTSSYAERVTCPVLLQWGTGDLLVTEGETETIYTHLATSQKRLVLYEQAGHYSLLSQDSLKWKAEVGSFLKTY